MYKIQFFSSTLQRSNALVLILPTILILVLQSCSPQYRLHRLIAHHPELTMVDSIHINDTVIVPGMKFDTSFVYSTKIDSVILQKDHLHLVIQKVHDTLVIHAAVDPDTIYISKVIPVTKIKVVKESFLTSFKSMLPWLVIALIALIVLAVLLHSWLK